MSDLSKATTIVVEYLARRPGVRNRLTDQVDAGMKAQNLESDRGSGHSTVVDEETAESVPTVSDTTGEAAIRIDRARRLLSELDAAESSLLTAANTLIGHPMLDFAELTVVVVRHGQLIPGEVKGSARVFDRALGEVLGRRKPDPGKSHDGRPYCQSCARCKEGEWFSEPNYYGGKPTDLAGQLPRKLRLCRTCVRFCEGLAKAGLAVRLPSRDELRHFRKHGKWPKLRVAA